MHVDDLCPPNVGLSCKPRKQAERPKDAVRRVGDCQLQARVRRLFGPVIHGYFSRRRTSEHTALSLSGLRDATPFTKWVPSDDRVIHDDNVNKSAVLARAVPIPVDF